jgi:hypothetical protein
MGYAKVYEIYDAVTGEFLDLGTAMELEERLGLDCDMIRAVGRGAQSSTKYKINQVSLDSMKAETASNIDAAQKWDAFCEPIRRKYGIPVYKHKEDDK